MRVFVLSVFFTLVCTYIYPINISAYLNWPRNVRSSGSDFFELTITNNENIALYNLELFVSNDENLEVILDKQNIIKLDPKEAVKINMEIVNKNKYYFSKETFVRLKISNDEYSTSIGYKLIIKPVENFWLFFILSVSLLLTLVFVIIYIKINKGEKDVG